MEVVSAAEKGDISAVYELLLGDADADKGLVWAVRALCAASALGRRTPAGA